MKSRTTERQLNTDSKLKANSELTTIAKPKTTLDVAIWDAIRQLGSFVSEPEFFTKMETVFGENINYQNLSSATLPALEVLSSEDLNGANGAYSVDTNTIYLSQEFINSNLKNPEAIADLLLEEIGHSIDNLLNETDTPGDEGEYFAAIVNNKTLSLAEIARITRENDTGTIIVNGKTISIEQQIIDGTNGDDNLIGTEKDDIISPGLGMDTVDGGDGDDLTDSKLF